MKKILWIAVLIILFLVPVKNLAAQEKSSTVSSEISPTPATIDYKLPYPGLLPDSPLYILKVVRDKIINFMIADTLKKAEFDLLQADKRLNSAIYLLRKKDKEELAASTISKGENYFEEAIGKTREAGKEGESINDISRRLVLSSKTQVIILKGLEVKVSSKFRKTYSSLRSRMEGLEKSAESLSKRK